MSDISLKTTGDLPRAISSMRNMSNKLKPSTEEQLLEDGQYVLDVIKGHIDNQDLGWTPLSKRTVELKGGDDTIYVDTSQLKDSFRVEPIKSSGSVNSVFIGASSQDLHDSGMKMSELMMWLEYGTDKIPPRPLIEPTKEEIESVLRERWNNLLVNLIKG